MPRERFEVELREPDDDPASSPLESGRGSLTDEEHRRWWRETGEAELRQLLYWRWDPIGVNDGFPTNEGEYDAYLLRVYRTLRDSAGTRDAAAQNVAKTLADIVRDEMDGDEYGVTAKDFAEVGERIADWYSNSQYGWKELRLPHQAARARPRPDVGSDA
jgi:hypothetical protein